MAFTCVDGLLLEAILIIQCMYNMACQELVDIALQFNEQHQFQLNLMHLSTLNLKKNVLHIFGNQVHFFLYNRNFDKVSN